MAYAAPAKSTKKESEYKSNYESSYKGDYESDWTIHKTYVDQNFHAWEAMLLGVVYDSVSKSVDGSKITDSYATTLAKERADRVIAKLPDGQTEPMGSADVGKAAFMDLLRIKYIYPNANAQHPYLEKLNMWEFYSSIYGYMPMFYDWNVSPTGYVGPDCWLWNPRNFIPQQGRTSLADMEYVTALTWVNRSYLQGILEDNEPGDAAEDKAEGEKDDNPTAQGGWDLDAIRELIANYDSAKKQSTSDSSQDSKVRRDRESGMTDRGICLATRFEAGPDGYWCTFAPDYGYTEIRKIKNPHKNSRIPFVIKYCQPLMDSFYGLGDFQRAMPLQFARDGLTNFYFKGIKMNLVPPIVANANGVVKHTIDYREGGVMLETIPNSVRRLETSTAGLATYQAAQQALTGSLLAQFGSQNADAAGSQTLNPSQGRTPAAINLYSDKEATRDGAARRHLETAIQQLTEGFYSLIANIGTEEIPLSIFLEDVKKIAKEGMADVWSLFTEKNLKTNDSLTAGELRIKPGSLKGVEYRFKINPDSTAKINQQAQLQALMDMIDRLGKYQNILQEDPTITIHWDQIMQVFTELTDIPGANSFITFDPNATKAPEPQAPPPMQLPSPTAVQLPGGQLKETADLVKLYQLVNDQGVREQILEAMGFHLGNSGDLTDAQEPQPMPEPPQPTVSKTGHVFSDPSIAAAADAIHEHAKPLTTAPREPKPPVAKPAAK